MKKNQKPQQDLRINQAVRKKPTKKPSQKHDTPNQDDIFADFFEQQPSPRTGHTAKEDQQRQWISDQVMWETTLGIREDETVNKVLSTKDQPKNTPVTATPQTQHRPGNRQQQQIQQPKMRRTSTAAVAPNKPRPGQGAAQRKPIQNPTRTAMGQANNKTGSNTRLKHQSVTPQRRNTTRQAQLQHKVTAQFEAKTADAGPAVFETRDTNPYVNTQDLTEIKQKLKSDKLKNFALNHWSKLAIAIVSFVLGYMLGTNSLLSPIATTAKPAGKNTVNYTPAIPRKEESLRSDKPKPKNKNSATPNITRNTKPTETYARELDSGSKSIVYNQEQIQQYDGKDIPFQDELGEPDSENNNTQMVVEPTATSAETDSVENAGDETPDFTQIDGAANVIKAEDNADSTTMDESPLNTETSEPEESKLEQLLDESLLSFEDKDWPIVIDLSNQILAIDANITSALINRSVAYTELGEFDLALEDCNLALNINPENPLAINNRGYTYEKMGNIDLAIKDYQSACEFGIELSCKEAERLKELSVDSEN